MTLDVNDGVPVDAIFWRYFTKIPALWTYLEEIDYDRHRKLKIESNLIFIRLLDGSL